MSVIKVMSENLANKIAAGEVVEKCSSVVKELVENSIDAGSKNIKIELKKGGIDEITVIDDGKGMDKEDALLAFQRHATSKIYKDDDLFFINTLGFRGEALPSIASVSEVVLDTCSGEVGTKIHIKGGELLSVENSQAKIGTKITITNLFYNVPARLKHLKAEVSELASITSFIEKISLSESKISFTLINNDKVILKTTGSGNLLKCIHEIYGGDVSSKMMSINALSDDFEVKGFVSKPEILKSTRNHLITIINGRVVKNYDINKAINDAYYTYKPDGKYPIVVLLIETDPTLVDVNIHPTKQDVKISKIKDLYELLYNNIKDSLYNNLLIPNPISKEESEEIKTSFTPIKNYENNFKDISGNQTKLEFNIIEDSKEKEIEKNEDFKKLDLSPIGIAFSTYIICQSDEGLVLIDQHAAQERINYELFFKKLKEEKTNTTPLLVPITIEMTNSEYITFENYKEEFKNLGFIFEEFGINTIIIKEHPTWLKKGYEEVSIRQILDLFLTNNGKFDIDKFRENVAITLSCKLAIKAHDHISMLEVEELLKNLMKCDNPYNCPHGRPTMIKFSEYELEKMFKRVM